METNSMTIDAFIKRVRAVEGFIVEVKDQNVQAGGNKQVKVKLSTRRSPNSWTSSKWIKERISQESLDKFAFSVRWGNSKSKPQCGTELKTIRESYPAAFGSDARNAAQVRKEMEESISELQLKLNMLKGAVRQKKQTIDAEMRALVVDSKKKRASLMADIRALETASLDLARQLKREKKEHARLKAKNENLETASLDLARQLEEKDKQLEEKTKLAAMNASQIDKKATSEGKKKAKDEAIEALEDAFFNLPHSFPGLKVSIQTILGKNDFDAKSLVSTLVARLNAAKWDVDKYMKENKDLRK